MLRSTTTLAVLAAAALAGPACDSNPITAPTNPGSTPAAVTEQFSDDLNPNGARTHQFTVTRAGTVTARITSLAPDSTVTIGLSLGTWNGAVCQIILANDNATLNTSVVGNATATGSLCVRLYDVGRLTQTIQYTVDVTHF
jgi:hypothetical protein